MPLPPRLATSADPGRSYQDAGRRQGGGGIGGPAPVDAGPLSMLRLVLYGRFILQVVPTMVSGVSILASTFQPQPVCSSSNIDLSARLPNEEM